MTSNDNCAKRKSSFGESSQSFETFRKAAAAGHCDEFESFSSSVSPASALNDLGVWNHERGDVAEALACYQRALQSQLEGSSPVNELAEGGNTKRRRRCGPSPAAHYNHRNRESWSLLEPSPADAADSADYSSSLIGMGRFVVPLLTTSDFSSPREDGTDKDILTPLVLYNTSLANMAADAPPSSSSKALVSAKSLLELALVDLDNKAPFAASTAPTKRNDAPFLRLRLMVLTNLGVTHYRLGKFGDAFDAFRQAAVAATDLLPRPEEVDSAKKGANDDDIRSSPLRRRSILRCLIYLLLNCARARDAQGAIEKAADSSPSSSTRCQDEALVLVREARSLCEDILQPAEEKDDYDTELSSRVAFVEAVLLRRRRRRGDLKQAAELYSGCLRRTATWSLLQGEDSTAAAVKERQPQKRRQTALRAAAALHGLGEALFELRSLSSCLQPLRTAWSIRCAYLGSDHPDAIESMYALARALHDSEEMTDASSLYERVHRLQKRVLGPGHVETLKTLCNLARVRRACGRGNEALDACDEAVRAGTDALGDDHPYVLEMQMIRAAVLRELGRTREGYVAFGELVRRAAAGGEGEGDDSDSGWLVKRVHRLLAEFLREPCLGGMDSGAAAA